MWLLDHSSADPAENLALDEALLDEAEAGRGGEVLRFWESPSHFVVLGLSQAVDQHVYQEACAADAIPVLRRCSAGGCVLQGPGCLNYSVVLRADRPGCETIHASYQTILGTVAEALADVGVCAELAGISDLAVSGYKVSGSAQRRRKTFFLHHGTLLTGFDISRCQRYLKEPSDQPEYRSHRTHESFMCNLQIDRPSVIRSVSLMFQAIENKELSLNIRKYTEELVHVKYSVPAWNLRK